MRVSYSIFGDSPAKLRHTGGRRTVDEPYLNALPIVVCACYLDYFGSCMKSWWKVINLEFNAPFESILICTLEDRQRHDWLGEKRPSHLPEVSVCLLFLISMESSTYLLSTTTLPARTGPPSKSYRAPSNLRKHAGSDYIQFVLNQHVHAL